MRDISVEEQITVCFRYVDEDFEVNEDFLDTYNVPSANSARYSFQNCAGYSDAF